MNGYEGRPTRSQLDRMNVLDADLGTAISAVDALFEHAGAEINADLSRRKLTPVTRMSWEAWDRSRSS